MNIYVEWCDYFGEENAVPIHLSGDDPTFSDLFDKIRLETGQDPESCEIIFSRFDVTSIENFDLQNPLSWIGISDHATLRLKQKNQRKEQVVDRSIPPVNTDENSPRFEVEDVCAYQYLDEYGYVVIKNVLSAEEISVAETMCWEWIEQITEGVILQDDVQTWGSKSWPTNKDNGMISEPSIGQAEWIWYVRAKPNVKRAFTEIWGTEDLGVSFDGGNFFRPYAMNQDWRTKGGWFHVDQNSSLKPGKCCVQGLVSLKAATKETGGLCVIPKSLQHHDEFCQRNVSGGHFVPIHPKDPVLQQQSILVTCEPGDLLLWDSRVVHCNTPGSGSSVTDDLIRLAVYCGELK